MMVGMVAVHGGIVQRGTWCVGNLYIIFSGQWTGINLSQTWKIVLLQVWGSVTMFRVSTLRSASASAARCHRHTLPQPSPRPCSLYSGRSHRSQVDYYIFIFLTFGGILSNRLYTRSDKWQVNVKLDQYFILFIHHEIYTVFSLTWNKKTWYNLISIITGNQWTLI